MLNNTSNISHLILAQNYQCKEEIKSIKEKIQNFNIVLEADRFTSKNQIIYEAYYNMLYGYHNDYIRKYLETFLNDNKKFAKLPIDLIEKELDFSYKFGTMNTDIKLLVSNVRHFIREEYDKIEIVDYYLWT